MPCSLTSASGRSPRPPPGARDGLMTKHPVSVPAPSVRALLHRSSQALGSDPEARWIVAQATG